VVPGGWFRIVPADDLLRLARIRVDVPVELDHLWKVDIRKATAEPPIALREHLRRIVGNVAQRSRRVYTYRGTPIERGQHVAVWKRHDLRDRGAEWKVNREHPAVAAAIAGSLGTETLLAILETHLPIHDIHVHTANDLPVPDPVRSDETEMEGLARGLVAALSDRPGERARLLDGLHFIEPFSTQPDMARRIAEKLR
jgi:hypothetical protein